MILFHASDTHQTHSLITSAARVECDAIVLTGDIIANRGREGSGRVDPDAERRYQNNWCRRVAARWTAAFAGRDVIYVAGNHDFVDIGPYLIERGHPPDRLHPINDATPLRILRGVRFAGFRQIPFIFGEWVGEETDLTRFVDAALDLRPDVLVTHAPPGGILDSTVSGVTVGHGIPYLTNRLTYTSHNVKAHLFGHAHGSGGESVEEIGIQFFNGACHAKRIEIAL